MITAMKLIHQSFLKNALTLIFILLILSGCSTYSGYKPNIAYKTVSLEQAEPRIATVKQGQIEYYRFGKGSPIVLIEGYATDITSWNKQFLSALALRHEVIVFNNRNVGKSIIHSDRYESTDLAIDTHELIDELHLKSPAVLGISMGGMVAQQYAVLYPHQISHLILINTAIAGKQAVQPSADVRNALFNMPQNKFRRYIVAVKLFFPLNWRPQMSWSLAVDRFKPNEYTEIEPATVAPQQKQLVIHWIEDDKTAARIAHMQIPVLILNGDADIVIPPINSSILAQTIPNAELLRWHEGGHGMIYQFPLQLARVINDFIATE